MAGASNIETPNATAAMARRFMTLDARCKAAYQIRAERGLTNQANRRDEGRAVGPPRSVRVERAVRGHDRRKEGEETETRIRGHSGREGYKASMSQPPTRPVVAAPRVPDSGCSQCAPVRQA